MFLKSLAFLFVIYQFGAASPQRFNYTDYHPIDHNDPYFGRDGRDRFYPDPSITTPTPKPLYPTLYPKVPAFNPNYYPSAPFDDGQRQVPPNPPPVRPLRPYGNDYFPPANDPSARNPFPPPTPPPSRNTNPPNTYPPNTQPTNYPNRGQTFRPTFPTRTLNGTNYNNRPTNPTRTTSSFPAYGNNYDGSNYNYAPNQPSYHDRQPFNPNYPSNSYNSRDQSNGRNDFYGGNTNQRSNINPDINYNPSPYNGGSSNHQQNREPDYDPNGVALAAFPDEEPSASYRGRKHFNYNNLHHREPSQGLDSRFSQSEVPLAPF